MLDVEASEEELGVGEALLKDEFEALGLTSHPLIIPINAKSMILFLNNGFIKSFDIYYYKYKLENLK